MRHFARRSTLLPALAAGFTLLAGKGASGAPVPIPHGTLDLLAENQSIAPGGRSYLGLHFQLESGWHIYWQNPGDSGEPPRVSWQLPTGLTAGAIEWPTPHRLGSATVVDYGYNDSVLLLVPLRAAVNLAAPQAVQVAAEVRVLVCREMCIPGKAQVLLALSVKAQAPAADAKMEALFAAARKALPKPVPPGWRFRVTEGEGAFVLTGIGRRVERATFFPLVESQIDNAAPQRIQPAAGGFKMTLRKSNQLLKLIQRLKGVLALTDDEAYVIDVPVVNRGAALQNPGFGSPPNHSFEEGVQR